MLSTPSVELILLYSVFLHFKILLEYFIMEDTEIYEMEDIKKVLRRLGVKISNRGYQYTAYGISLVLQSREYLTYITKSLYIEIAVHYHTSWTCVERDIRTVVGTIWETDDRQLLYAICGGVPRKRPTNKEFFCLMYDYFTSMDQSEESDAMRGETGDCPLWGGDCEQVEQLQRQVRLLQEENRMLRRMLAERPAALSCGSKRPIP